MQVLNPNIFLKDKTKTQGLFLYRLSRTQTFFFFKLNFVLPNVKRIWPIGYSKGAGDLGVSRLLNLDLEPLSSPSQILDITSVCPSPFLCELSYKLLSFYFSNVLTQVLKEAGAVAFMPQPIGVLE